MLKTDEPKTDYISETHEAMALLQGPLIPLVLEPVALTGRLVHVVQIDSLSDLTAYIGRECWLQKSGIIDQWYLLVPGGE